MLAALEGRILLARGRNKKNKNDRMRQKDRARERYWQTAVFNRAAQIQTQSWPVIGRLWLGLGTGGGDSCLEMMEAPEKGDRKERHHDNNPELL